MTITPSNIPSTSSFTIITPLNNNTLTQNILDIFTQTNTTFYHTTHNDDIIFIIPNPSIELFNSLK